MADIKWLFFTYQVPATPSTHRAYVWRKLRSAGALYLQNSICVLPQTPATERLLGELGEEISQRNGESRLFHVALYEEAEEASIIQQFRQQMDEEYAEFLEQCAKLHAELDAERKRDKYTFGELEENEADYTKLHAWLPRLIARDYFSADRHGIALDELERCAEDVRLYESQVNGQDIGTGG